MCTVKMNEEITTKNDFLKLISYEIMDSEYGFTFNGMLSKIKKASENSTIQLTDKDKENMLYYVINNFLNTRRISAVSDYYYINN